MENKSAQCANANLLQSKTIDSLRFPLALMVVFIHQEEQFIEHTTNTLDVVFNFSYSFLSHTITAISVPLFFLFSGYLYFYKIEKFDKGVYFSKTRKRVNSTIVLLELNCCPILFSSEHFKCSY